MGLKATDSFLHSACQTQYSGLLFQVPNVQNEHLFQHPEHLGFQLIVRIALCASYVLYSVGSQINWYCVLDFISCQGFQPGLLDINQKHIFSNVLIYIYLMFKVICDHLSVFQHMESVIIDFSSMLWRKIVFLQDIMLFTGC